MKERKNLVASPLRVVVLALVFAFFAGLDQATAQNGVLVKVEFGDIRGDDWIGWDLLVNGTTNARASGGGTSLKPTFVWIDAGATATIGLQTTGIVSRQDYELYIDDMRYLIAKPANFYTIEDPAGIMGNRYVDHGNTFSPVGKVITIRANATVVGRQSVTPEGQAALTTDPINTLTGNLEFDETDIAIPAPGIPLDFRRRYNSRQSAAGPFGPQWSHTYDWSVRHCGFASGASSNTAATNVWALVRDGEGIDHWFPASNLVAGVYGACADNNWALSGGTNGYRLTLPGSLVYAFDTNGTLRAVSNAWGNALELTYTGTFPSNLLTSVRHSANTNLCLTFNWTSNRIGKVLSPSTNLWVEYKYDSKTNLLTNVTQRTASGNFTRGYGYLSDSGTNFFNTPMTQRVNRAGQVFSYRWPTNGAMTCTNLVLGASNYWHGIAYGPSGTTDVTYYRSDGTDLAFRYRFDTNALDLLQIERTGASMGFYRFGVRYAEDAAGNLTNEAPYEGSVSFGGVYSQQVVRAYDAFHNVTNLSTAFGAALPSNVWSLAWDTNIHALTTIQDPCGYRGGWEYTNGAVRRAWWYTTGSNLTWMGCDYANGLVTNLTNNGGSVAFQYDAFGRLAGVTPSVGAWVSYSNNLLGYTTQITVPGTNGARTIQLGVTELGWVTNVLYPDGSSERFAYDPLGNVTNYVDVAGRSTDYRWAPSGNLSAEVLWLAGSRYTNRVDYDNQLNVLRLVDAKNRAVETYKLDDITDRIKTVTNLENQTLTVSYALGDRVKSIARFDGTTVGASYNGDGWLSTLSYPDSTNLFDYYPNGTLRTARNEEGLVTNRLNPNGWLYSQTGVGPAATVTYGWNNDGWLTSMIATNGSCSYVRTGPMGRILRTHVTPPGLPSNAILYRYTTNSLLSFRGLSSGSGLTVTNLYDDMDRLVGVEWRNASSNLLRSFRYTYDQAERISKIELEDGSRVEYDYDEWDRLIAERTVGRSGWQGPFTNTVSYEYDVAGNRTAKKRGGTTITYAYSNGCDRLVGWNAASTDGYAVAASLNVAGYASEAIVTNPNLGYLWVSNRAMATPVTLGATNFLAWGFPVRDGTNEFRVSVSDLAGNAAQAVCTSIVQLATNAAYGFNAAGCVTNLRYWCAAYTNETALRWDGQYRLRSVATNGTDVERNGYDAFGRRLWSWDGTATNWYVHAGPHVVAETDAAGVLRRGYFYAEGVDDALAMSVHTGAVAQIFYYIKDHLGSVHGLVDTNGVVVESYRYDAWGRVLGVYDAKGAPRERSAYGNRILWQGREYSWNTGLYYFRARWYDPVTGRWLSNDPIGISGGLNQYVFCANNPVNFRDPWGLKDFDLDLLRPNDSYIRDFHNKLTKEPEDAEYFDVGIHGDPKSAYLWNSTTRRLDPITAVELAAKIRAAGHHRGQVVRLYSCDTGRDDNGFAQQLANALKSNVIAPTRKWYADPGNGNPTDGTISSGTRDFTTGRLIQNGRWRGFSPVAPKTRR